MYICYACSRCCVLALVPKCPWCLAANACLFCKVQVVIAIEDTVVEACTAGMPILAVNQPCFRVAGTTEAL